MTKNYVNFIMSTDATAVHCRTCEKPCGEQAQLQHFVKGYWITIQDIVYWLHGLCLPCELITERIGYIDVNLCYLPEAEGLDTERIFTVCICFLRCENKKTGGILLRF